MLLEDDFVQFNQYQNQHPKHPGRYQAKWNAGFFRIEWVIINHSTQDPVSICYPVSIT